MWPSMFLDRRSTRMAFCTRILALSWLLHLGLCQSSSSAVASSAAAASSSAVPPSPYSYLQPPLNYTDGGFNVPNTGTGGQVFRQGSSLNVSWWTTYPTVNLWQIRYHDYATPYALIGATSKRWYVWEVDDHGDHSLPFELRATNPEGSEDDQLNGGFWTGQFWIHPASGASSSISDAATQTTLSSAATSLRTTRTGATSSASSTGSSSGHHDSGSNSVAIGAGVGVGVGVAVILAGVFAFWFWRRRSKRNEQQQWPGPAGSVTSPSQGDSSTYWSHNNNNSVQPYYASNEMMQNDYPYRDSSPPAKPYQPSELGNYQSPVEAPNNQEPRELPAGHPMYK